MGKDTVFANGKSVATVGTDHVAVNEQEWDELLVAPTKAQMPTMNIAYMPTLMNGSTTTFYADSPVWTVAGYLSESVEYPTEPAGSLGLKTGNPYRGPTVCVMGSPTVFVEGNAVVRHHDPTKQDGGNSSGKVLMKSDLERLKKALDDERARRAAAAAAAKKKKGRGATRKKPKIDKKVVQATPAETAKAARLVSRKALIAAGRAKKDTYPPGDPRREVLANAANRLEKNNTAVEMARLSQSVYQDSGAPPGWRRAENYNNRISGFQGALYVSTDQPPRYVLAFRGTEMESGKLKAAQDWLANLNQGTGSMSVQYTEAWMRAQSAARRHGGNLTITGHSLGGGLASLASIATHTPAYTFNSAGLNPVTALRFGASGYTRSNQLISAYRIQGEILTQQQEEGYLRHAMADALGTKYDLYPSLPATVDADATARHGIQLVIDEIEELKKSDGATLETETGLKAP